MSTIIVRQAAAAESPEVLVNDCPLKERPRVEQTYITLGQILLQTKEFRDEHTTGWIKINRISRLCNKYWKHLPRINFHQKDLDMATRVHFEKVWAIHGPGVRVTWKTETTGPGGPFLFIKFDRLYPDGRRA